MNRDGAFLRHRGVRIRSNEEKCVEEGGGLGGRQAKRGEGGGIKGGEGRGQVGGGGGVAEMVGRRLAGWLATRWAEDVYINGVRRLRKTCKHNGRRKGTGGWA